MSVQNGLHFAQESAERQKQITDAIAEDLRPQRTRLSMDHLANLLSCPGDEVSSSSLYKFQEGTRHFPLHKLSRLWEVTGGRKTVQVLAAQCGFICYDVNVEQHVNLETLPSLIGKFSDFISKVTGAQSPESPGGADITEEELAEIIADCDRLVAAALHAKEVCRSLHLQAGGAHGSGAPKLTVIGKSGSKQG